MLLVTFSIDGGPPRLGMLADGAVAALDGAPDMLTVIRTGGELTRGRSWPADAVRLHAPFRPGKIVGVGLNYVEHVDESHRSLDTAKELPDRPVLFGKPATAVVGPGEPIRHDGDLTQQLDWECELAVVIGRLCRDWVPSEIGRGGDDGHRDVRR